jgi:hypothetical protein
MIDAPETNRNPNPCDAQNADVAAASEETNVKEAKTFATAQTVQPKLRVRAR